MHLAPRLLLGRILRTRVNVLAKLTSQGTEDVYRNSAISVDESAMRQEGPRGAYSGDFRMMMCVLIAFPTKVEEAERARGTSECRTGINLHCPLRNIQY